MLKKILVNMDKYMYTCYCPKRSFNDFTIQCEFMGYLDGYFDEKMYYFYIENEKNNEDLLEIYAKGYKKGQTNRRKVKDDDPKRLIAEKEEWLRKLALFDTTNNIDNRVLSEYAFDYYDLYKDNIVLDLGSMKIKPLNKK